MHEPVAVYDGRLLLGFIHEAGGQRRAVLSTGRDLGLFTTQPAASNALVAEVRAELAAADAGAAGSSLIEKQHVTREEAT